MKKRSRSVISAVLLILFSLVFLSGVGYCIYYVSLGSTYYDGQATSIAEGYMREWKDAKDGSVLRSYMEVKDIAAKIPAAGDADALDAGMAERIGQNGLCSLQLLQGGSAARNYGETVGSVGREMLQHKIAAGEFASSGVYTDSISCQKCVAVYCPVYGSKEADGVIAYYAIGDLFGGSQSLHEKAVYYCLAETDGTVVESTTSDGEKDPTANVFTYIHNKTESKAETDAVSRLVDTKKDGAVTLHIGGKKYVAVCLADDLLGGDHFILQLFAQDDLLQEERLPSGGIFFVSAAIGAVSLLILIFCILFIRANRKKLLHDADVDPVLGCNTYSKFAYEARSLLEQNRFSRYAVVHFEIYRYGYLKEHLSPEDTENILKYIAKICKQTTDGNETFGHVMNDSFIALMHYMEVKELNERFKLLGAIVSSYASSQKFGVELQLSAGAYLVEGDRSRDVQKMFDCAKMALQVSNKRGNDRFTVYDSSIASAYLQEAELEVKMGTALKNRDFKLFFQPKYSISQDSVASAEVLVRWYDPEKQTYIAPDMFIRLFEANGFVSQLDRYVFEETCRFLSDLVSHGEKIVPLSVNVSRATAIQPGFLNFYVSKKREYGVEDGFLTLEFTETFASERSDTLTDLLFQLRSNGFKCSIDDFGMGNSSMIAVKELPVDELKFDRALIKRSKDPQKDDVILKLMIDVVKQLGMTVVQEGVETKEDMDRMRALGCDVIQGYYYARPMQVVDFIDFLKDDTSLAAVRRFQKQGTE